MAKSATSEKMILDVCMSPSFGSVVANDQQLTRNSASSQLVDRRVSRSKRAIRDAFIELSETVGFDEFTVNDLCVHADINRGTFYNHYKDKDDLATSIMAEFMDGISDFRQSMSELTLIDLAKFKIAKSPAKQIVQLFDYLREQSDLLSAMLGEKGNQRFRKLLQETLCTDIIMSMLHSKYKNSSDPFVDYYVAFYSAAYLGVINKWLQTGMNETSEDMARIAMRLLFIKPGESIVL